MVFEMWKRVVNIANTHITDICDEISPSHLMEREVEKP
jgi:hypothetical protein